MLESIFGSLNFVNYSFGVPIMRTIVYIGLYIGVP